MACFDFRAGALIGALAASASVGAEAKPQYNVNDYYQVAHEGRIYVFDDVNTYLSFLDTGETPFRLTRIGAGKNGESVVFGLREADKNMSAGLGSVALYDGTANGIEDGFYGEIVEDGRIYVFSTWDDLKAFRATGEAPLRFTDIGAGPKGETVVYVLNEGNKTEKPAGLMERFRKTHRR